MEKDNFKHEIAGCSLCRIENTEEVATEEAYLEPSPGTYKSKDVSPILTPNSKRSDLRKPGTARRMLELEKSEPMEVDNSDEGIELSKISIIGTNLASEREIVKEENIIDKSFRLFSCNICDKLSRSIVKLDTCDHVFCHTYIYDWNSISKKCMKCNKGFNTGNIVRLHKEMQHIHESLEVRCRKKGCLEELNLHKLTKHEDGCHARSATIKVKLGT